MAVENALHDLQDAISLSDKHDQHNKEHRKNFWDTFFLNLAGHRAQVANAAYASLLKKNLPVNADDAKDTCKAKETPDPKRVMRRRVLRNPDYITNCSSPDCGLCFRDE